MMFPTPKGYISIPDAVDRVVRVLHGGPETIPWRGKDLDKTVLHRGRKQTMEAQEWLVGELSAGRLVAEIGNIEVPAEYWTCNGAHTTAHTGCLEPPEIGALDYAALVNRPCFIERSVFERRLSPGAARPKGKAGKSARREPVHRADLKRFIEKRIADLKDTGGRSSARQDEQAARAHFKGRSITRDWIIEFREEFNAPLEWSKRGRRN